ncbi:MAG TPA: VCBS repeat-containing protein, partial [Tepidisphaeraceae bacterium]|nr:VCBS repeat-containing protein [Tepidisphaeraceae bacterium]
MPSIIEPLEDRTLLSAATLSPPVQVAVGADPAAVATADFNGDGLPDLVTANASGTISILLNTGNGTFAPAQTLAAGLRPTSVAVGDFNGDTKPDIAVADAATGTIKIFLNPGDGVFDLSASYTYGTAPGVSSSPEAQLVTGDFTDDGKTDLAVADDTDNKIAVLLGNGNGTFASPVDTPFSDITDIAAANFDNSGMSDLAVIQSGADQVDTLLSSGGGTFGGKLTETLPGQPTSLAVGDFNGDGNPDLAVAMTESAHDAIDIAFGSGLGNFSSNATLTVPSPISALVAGDFIPPATGADSTGLAAIAPTGTVIVYQNNGAGTLLAAQTITSSSGAATVTSLAAAAADFTGAGTLGLAFPVSTSATTTGSGDIDVLLPQSSVVSTGLVAGLSGALPVSAISGSKTKLSQILTLTNNTSKTIGGKATITLYLSPTTTVLSGATPVLSLTRSV